MVFGVSENLNNLKEENINTDEGRFLTRQEQLLALIKYHEISECGIVCNGMEGQCSKILPGNALP